MSEKTLGYEKIPDNGQPKRLKPPFDVVCYGWGDEINQHQGQVGRFTSACATLICLN